jgi:hypothetical protein
MLATWTLENFKSIGGELKLSLSPITILVGANSSGKSSIIQSILLIKQTLQYATPDRPIALNGPLLKLGNYTDVKNVTTTSEGFRIGWDYDSEFLPSLFPSIAESIDTNIAYRSPFRSQISKIQCATHFGIDQTTTQSELSLLQPSLISCFLSSTTGHSNDQHIAKMSISRINLPLDEVFAKRFPSSSIIGYLNQIIMLSTTLIQKLS